MKPMAILGVLLIAIGIAGLAIDNISFTERKTIVDAGPIKVTADEQRTIPIPTIAGIVAVIAGAGGLVTDWDGTPVTLGSTSRVLAARTPELHAQALRRLQA